MDYSQYEDYGFERVSAFNLSTGYEQRSYQAHWHSYGEILLVGPGKTNIFQVNRDTYELVEGDFLLIWPMEMHAIIDADRKESLVIQFSNAFMNSLFDLQRIMHFYRNEGNLLLRRAGPGTALLYAADGVHADAGQAPG